MPPRKGTKTTTKRPAKSEADLESAADDILRRIDEEEAAASQPLSGMRKRAERFLDGDGDTGESMDVAGNGRLGGMLEDPETASEELAEGVVETALIAEAEALDLAAFSRKNTRAGSGGDEFERDSFEEWVRISKKYPPLPAKDLESWVRMAKSDDPEMVSLAEDRLIRHNVLWIVQCLQRKAGREIMNRPDGLREDMLGIARWGFLIGIRKYDEVRAGKNGRDTKANILTYTKFWIDKLVGEQLGVERYGLKEEAALDRDRILKARVALIKSGIPAPAPEAISQYLEAKVLEKLTAAGKTDITRDMMRRRGALGIDRIREILNHSITSVSLDAPAGGDDDAPGIVDYLTVDAPSALDDVGAQERLGGIVGRLTLTSNRRHEQAFRMLHGLPAGEKGGRYPVFTGAEIGLVFGTSREAVERGEEQVRAELWGETVVSSAERNWTDMSSRIPVSIASDIRQLIDLRKLVVSEGIALNDVDAPRATGKSPFGAKPNSKLFVTKDTFVCNETGLEGDVFAWLVARRGLTRDEATVEGMRLAQRMPNTATKVTIDRVRAKRLSAHR